MKLTPGDAQAKLQLCTGRVASDAWYAVLVWPTFETLEVYEHRGDFRSSMRLIVTNRDRCPK